MAYHDKIFVEVVVTRGATSNNSSTVSYKSNDSVTWDFDGLSSCLFCTRRLETSCPESRRNADFLQAEAGRKH